MSQKTQLVETLKRVLKTHGITYADLAKKLGLSEASVKRVFADNTFTLERLEEICEIVGMTFYQLATMAAGKTETEKETLTDSQEIELAKNEDLLIYFYLLLEGLAPSEIRKRFTFTEKESITFLRKLDAIGVIELHPNDRVRLRVSRLVKWDPEGLLIKAYGKRLNSEFFQSSFKGDSELLRLVPGKISRASFHRLRQKTARLLQEYDELLEFDSTLPDKDKEDVALLIAYRPWRFSIMDKRRK